MELPPAAQAPERSPAAVAPVAPPPPSPLDVRAELESTGLQMVETRSERASAPEPEPVVALGRPRRERPKLAAEDEPLVQVETKQ
jgi:hypothetical protein